MTELRAWDYLFLSMQRQQVVDHGTIWDSQATSDDYFICTDAAVAMKNFLNQRAAFLDLYARELRVADVEGMSRLSARLSAALLGTVTFPGENSSACPSAFDLFDFMDLDVPEPPALPKLDLLQGLDFNTCSITRADGTISTRMRRDPRWWR